ncbi:ankyrin repeat domain-containing protein [Sutcliffiella horikoshii]|uniref:ankyrin repeat domain-containing protein n=1 Tax=Sutcliffiella horikoshii TaxID=79883 RepID=UPI001F375198|nr:ankyrin repeat domain-containing protein [Sutcliffiella horikoshii]
MTEIMKAILLEDTVLLVKMLEAGHDVNFQDDDGRTPLMQAVIDQHIEMATLLIQYGAHVNMQDYLGETAALHFAAQNNSAEITEVLLKNGAEIDLEDINGNTPLSDAIFYFRGDEKVIQQLLKHEADRERKNKHDVSPLELARSIGGTVLSLLLGADSK